MLNAASGLFTDLDSVGRMVGAPPVYTPVPLASTYGAIHGALAVTLALYARAESGRGEVIEVPLLGAALAATGILLYRVAKQPVRYGMPVMPRCTERFLVPLLRAYVRLTGGPGWRAILRRLGRLYPGPNDSYRTGDGGWVFLLAGGNSNHSQAFLKAMGLYDELIEAGMVDRSVYDNLELTNNVQEWTMLRKSWKRRIRKRLTRLFAEQPATHWEKLLDGTVPFSPQRTADEWLHAPEALTAGLTVDVDDPRHGKMRQLGVQVSLAGTPERWFNPRAAADGELEAVLRELERAPAADQPATGAAAAGEGAAHSEGAALLEGAVFMVATDTHRPGGEPHGQRARGEHALARLYRARDGWLFVQGLPSDLARAAAIDELAGFPVGEARDSDRVRFLEAAIRRRPVAFWAVAFNQAGLGCHRVDSIEDIRREYLHEMTAGNLTRNWDDGRSISAIRIADHPAGSPVDTVAPAYARFRNTSLRLCRPMPYLGSDSRAILLEAGYPETRIDELLASGVVKQRFHRDYLPG